MARTTVQLRRRSLKFYALHTGESLTTTYWENGSYIPGELDRVNYILRDFRANEVKPIDPTLLDLLTRIHYRLGTIEPFQVISGYRSPADQRDAPCEQRRRRGAQPAHRRQGDRHLRARPQPRAASRRRAGAAIRRRRLLPEEQFVHVDTGRVRFW